MPYSGDACGIFASRSSSRIASFSTTSGIFAFAIFSRQLADLDFPRVALPEFLLNRAHLLVQEVLALLLLELPLHVALNLGRQFEHVDLLRQVRRRLSQSIRNVKRLENLLPLHEVQSQIGREKIAKRPGLSMLASTSSA